MESAIIKDTDFTEEQLEIIGRCGLGLKQQAINIMRRYANRTIEERTEASRPPKQVSAEEAVLFINSNIEKTENYQDFIPLKDLYNLYRAYLKSEGKIMKIITKQSLRKIMEDMDFHYGKGPMNKSVFRFVQVIEQETDEDWEL